MGTTTGHGFWFYNDEWPLTLADEDDRPEAPLALPAVDVVEQGDAVVLTAELPGLAREEIDVEVSSDRITIAGKHHEDAAAVAQGYYRHERLHEEFKRTVALPVEVEVSDVTAELEDGVLKVTAHRRPALRTAHVDVTPPRH